MLEPSACRFWQLALQSGLVDATALQACWDAIPPDRRVIEHIDRRLARQAVQSGLLTLWQAQQLMLGRTSGFKIDRYVLLDLIGQGGMGRVYMARDSRLNRRVAVKILTPERMNNPRAKVRFEREAAVGAQLQHENLVRIYDKGEANGKCYLVMEFIEGKTIGGMIAENGPLPPSVAARLTRQIALGLDHAQRKGLIHRDVNPYNILVTRDGIAKLTDLGLAIEEAETERVTRDGATVGTFDYVSPEQARHSHDVDIRTDIYSLGCSLYHMLTGQVPFPSASLPEKLWGHQRLEPAAISSLAPGVPEGLIAVVGKMMRKSREERYTTPLDVAQALEPYVEEPPTGDYPLAVQNAATLAAAAAPTQTLITAATSAPPVERLVPPGEPPSITPSPEPAIAPEAGPISPFPSNDGPIAGLNLAVDLGPEPPLSASTSTGRNKARSRTTSPTSTAVEAESTSGGRPTTARPRWLVPAGIAAAVLVVFGFFFVFMKKDTSATTGPKTAGKPGKTAPSSVGKSAEKAGSSTTARSESAATAPATPEKKSPSGKEVAVVAADGTRKIEADFATALRAAIGRKGHVLLANAKPLEFKAGDAVNISGGALAIRAADHIKPELHVEIKGSKPFLATRAETPLRIEGVMFVVKYVNPGANPPAVIEAGGTLTLDRCAFRVEGDVPNARAVVCHGGSLTVSGCWFENFDRTIDVDSFRGSVTTIRQSMLLHAQAEGETKTEAGAEKPKNGDSSKAPARPRWGLRVLHSPGGFARSGRRLILDHCTYQGSTFLDFIGFSPESPLAVEASGCAVLADALLAWEPVPRAPEVTPLTRDALSWSGRGNQFDVRGTAWIARAEKPGQPPAPWSDGPTNLEQWSKLLGNERDPVPPPVRFATDPSARSDHPTPRDFAVQDHAAGANPAFVGPGASPAKSR